MSYAHLVMRWGVDTLGRHFTFMLQQSSRAPSQQTRGLWKSTVTCWCAVMHCAGGKWTTYRRMAEDAVDSALATGRVQVTHQCATSRLKLIGGQDYKPTLHTEVGRGFFAKQPRPATCCCTCEGTAFVKDAARVQHGQHARVIISVAQEQGLPAVVTRTPWALCTCYCTIQPCIMK